MTLASRALEISKSLSNAEPAAVSATLCSGLQEFLGQDFTVRTGRISDSKSESDSFDAIVSTAAHGENQPDDSPTEADRAVAVVDIYERIDREGLRAACEKIAKAKGLEKTAIPDGEPARTNSTFGAILARSASVPVEVLSEELDKWRESSPHLVWPDLVVILGTAVIGYGAQFPTEGVGGDFMLPSARSRLATPPPIYVLGITRPITDFAFSKMASLIVAHAKLFLPNADLPNFTEIVEGMPNTALTQTGYQFNLAGDLVPVPRDQYNDRLLPTPPLYIDGADKTRLGSVQLLPWQDGHVVLLRGKIPLEGLLVFGSRRVARTPIIRRPNNVTLSHVLQLSAEEFSDLLRNFQQRSNMRITRGEAKWVVQKIGDEGTSSPFVARLMLGVIRARDMIYAPGPARDRFDSLYESMMAGISSAREAAKEIDELWESHSYKIAAGEGIRRGDRTLHIDENVDRQLRKGFETFLNASVRALKYGLQQLALELKCDLGFCFQKQSRFERGLADLRIVDADLADYVARCRNEWLQPLVDRRNDVEHEGWTLPRVAYRDTGLAIEVSAPMVDGQPVDQYVTGMADRACCMVEDVVMHLINKNLPALAALSEVPLRQRDPQNPERFRMTIRAGGEPLWLLRYPDTPFEST